MLFRRESERIKRYKRIRAVGKELTGQIGKHVPRFVLIKAARDLDMRGPKGVLVFDSEDEVSFLMDRCFYDIYWEGKNLIGHFIASDAYDQLTEEEHTIVQGMTTGYYSLFEILDTNRVEATVELGDVLGEGRYTIMDVNMSRTVRKGCLLACRIHQTAGIYMSTGTGCPFEPNQKEVLLEGLERKRRPATKSKKRGSAQKLQRSDYSAYFFKQYKRIGRIKFMIE